MDAIKLKSDFGTTAEVSVFDNKLILTNAKGNRALVLSIKKDITIGDIEHGVITFVAKKNGERHVNTIYVTGDISGAILLSNSIN